MSTLIEVSGQILDKDQIETAIYDTGKATVVLRSGRQWVFHDPQALRRALAPWLERPDDATSLARLRRLLVEQRAQAIRAEERLGPFVRARLTKQMRHRKEAEAWVREQLGEGA